TAQLDFAAVPRLPGVDYYLAEGCIAGGTLRNFDSYGARVAPISDGQRNLLCDPQTTGGLAVGVAPARGRELPAAAGELGPQLAPIGRLVERRDHAVEVL